MVLARVKAATDKTPFGNGDRCRNHRMVTVPDAGITVS
jgi:hypothetical protein